ncbi:hypothetical protein [Streptomyces sp. NPDC046182]|uniref:hypothetical protein n=1 Tax=Streptomyces sp. NPDC046182 TaxID=3154601 RepID=UPI00340D46E7
MTTDTTECPGRSGASRTCRRIGWTTERYGELSTRSGTSMPWASQVARITSASAGSSATVTAANEAGRSVRAYDRARSLGAFTEDTRTLTWFSARGGLPQVLGGDHIRPAPARIGVAGLPAGGDDDHQQDDAADRRAPGRMEHGEAAEGEDEQDLLGGVRDGGERVAAGDRQGEPLGQQGLAEPAAVERPPHQQAFRRTSSSHKC